MTRTVVDTNIIISASLNNHSSPAKALDYVLENHTILLSTATYKEMSTKLLNKKFDKYVRKETRQQFLKSLLDIAEMINIEKTIKACRDEKDDMFLELAINGEAEFIITGDKDLLVLHPFETVKIITAADFLHRYI